MSDERKDHREQYPVEHFHRRLREWLAVADKRDRDKQNPPKHEQRGKPR